ncbi:hypothetical protein ACWDA3_29580 [Nonomuraea rubra]
MSWDGDLDVQDLRAKVSRCGTSRPATARGFRFHERPEVPVHARADPAGECVWGGDRTNLPDQVEPNVTYRDTRIDFRVAAILASRETRQ